MRLTALVGARILTLASADGLQRLATAVETAVRGARGWGELQTIVQRAVLERLTVAGITAAPLKGPHLAMRAHGDLGLRPSADVDILVAPDFWVTLSTS